MAARKSQSKLDLELVWEEIVFSDEEIDHARGVTAASAHDTEDAKELLGALGLLPDQEKWWNRWPGKLITPRTR